MVLVSGQSNFILKNNSKELKQAERLKSRERRPEVDRLDGQYAGLSIGSIADRSNISYF